MVESRRKARVFNMPVLLTMMVGDVKISTHTRDLSRHRIYFYMGSGESSLLEHDFEFLLEPLSEIARLQCFIRCKGRLIQREAVSPSLMGIDAKIVHYSILKRPDLVPIQARPMKELTRESLTRSMDADKQFQQGGLVDAYTMKG